MNSSDTLAIGLSRPAVLVIDDCEIDRQRMRELLAADGFRVRELAAPIGATRVAREFGAHAVVIGQSLPALSGSKLAALFRGDPALRHIRLVLIAGDDAAGLTGLAREARTDACVSKHRLHGELVATLKRVLAGS